MTSTPFPNLAALQGAHLALAQGVPHDGATLPPAEAIREFVARAVETGRVLDQRDDRQAAQSLINYWVSRVANAARLEDKPVASLARKSNPGDGVAEKAHRAVQNAAAVFGPEVDTLLAEFDPGSLRDAVADADARLRQAGADPKLVRRLLLRLVRLRPADPGFDPAPASRASLRDLPGADAATVDRLVNELAAAGVVRVTPGPTNEADLVALRPAVLKLDWPPLREAQESRRQFRARAAESARSTAASGAVSRCWLATTDFLAVLGRGIGRVSWGVGKLFGVRPEPERLSAEEQDDAEEFNDLNENEVRFLRASRGLQRKLTEINRTLVWLMIVAVVFVLAGWSTAAYQRHVAEGHRREAEQNADRAHVQEHNAESQARIAEARLKLSSLRLVVRAWSEVITARTPEDQRIAQTRWESLTAQKTLTESLGKEVSLPNLRAAAGNFQMAQNAAPSRATPDSVQLREDVKKVRNELVRQPETRQALREARTVAFALVRKSVENIKSELDGKRSYTKVEPFAREFWAQYWGEMLLVERQAVEEAMIEYGNVLKSLQGPSPPKPEILSKALAEPAKQLLAAIQAEEPGPLPGEPAATK
ncbi:MAG: hypothetical protein ACJ8F7_14865 [Gemmataceae bacterium]